MTSFEVIQKCHSLNLFIICLRIHPAPSKCLSQRISWIISRIPHRISKILFALGADEFLAMLEGKVREAPFFKVQSGKITVCAISAQTSQEGIKCTKAKEQLRSYFPNMYTVDLGQDRLFRKLLLSGLYWTYQGRRVRPCENERAKVTYCWSPIL